MLTLYKTLSKQMLALYKTLSKQMLALYKTLSKQVLALYKTMHHHYYCYIQVPGYTRKDDGNSWVYSDKVCQILAEYTQRSVELVIVHYISIPECTKYGCFNKEFES